jgi:hypothetical protein
MRQVFKELIWDNRLGRVVAVIGFLDLAYSLYLLVAPDVAPLKTGHIDNRIWYAISFAFLIYVAISALRGANEYKKRLEGEDNIRIVYNEERHSTCREIGRNAGRDVETIRVGYRVIGKKSIDNPVVLPSKLVSVDKAGKYTNIPITPIPLSPLVPAQQVHPGRTIMHWVNVFIHGLDSNVISLLYENQPAQLIVLTTGEYRLDLVARGVSTKGDIGTLILDIDDRNKLHIALEGVDLWSTE